MTLVSHFIAKVQKIRIVQTKYRPIFCTIVQNSSLSNRFVASERVAYGKMNSQMFEESPVCIVISALPGIIRIM